MKIRIGVSGSLSSDLEAFHALCESTVTLGFDSIWLPEVLTQAALDPYVALAWAAAQFPTLKLGGTFMLPGRNPLRMARQIASLDLLSGGRLLATFVSGIATGPERSTLGVEPRDRGGWMDEALPLLRQWFDGAAVHHQGVVGNFEGVSLHPLPHQQPLEFWLGGALPSALERVGRCADGWLPAMISPEEALAGRKTIEAAADRAERVLSDEHYGISIPWSEDELSVSSVTALAARYPGKELGDLIPVGMQQLQSLLKRFIDVGFSKFVLRPLGSADGQFDRLAHGVLGLQTGSSPRT
ncbi:MAG: LLM class flavin-dependent oxidoreductase [Actinomycetes bacterium]